MGWKIVTAKGMLLEAVGLWAEKKIEQGYKIFDLIYCEWCSSTLFALAAHGFAFLLGILPFEWNWQLLARYPLVVMGSSLISGLTWTIYLTINDIKENNRAQTEYFNSINYEYGKDENNG